MSQLNLFTSEEIPPWLPPQAKEARSHVFWAQIVSFIEIPISVFLTILLLYYYFRYSSPSFVRINPNAASLASAFFAFAMYFIAIVIVSVLELAFIRVHVSNPIDSGKFVVAEERAVLWGVLSILFGLIPGIMLIASAMSLRELNKHATSVKEIPAEAANGQPPSGPAPPGGEAKKPVQPPQTPAKQPQPFSVPAASKQHSDMVKCKKCGASYPAFMHSCPSCNEPKS